MIVYIKKYWERIVLLLVTMAFFFLVGGGVYLQKQNKLEVEHGTGIASQKTATQPPLKTDSQTRDIASPEAASVYLSLSPGELMEQINNLHSLDEKVATAKFSGLPVMWPGYFFSLKTGEDDTTYVQLDVSEDGFGVILICDVDLYEYPDFTGIESGKKIWVAGEILAVDPSGTGTIYLKTDYFQFTEPEEAEPAAAIE